MNQPDIYQQEWCKDLIKRLGRYKEIQSRLEVLEILLDKKGIGPVNKLVATYGQVTIGSGLGVPANEEIEHREKSYEIKLLNAALNSLTDIDKAIIKLKYIEKTEDWHIYDLYLPKQFPKQVGKSNYFERKRDALKTMGRCLGYNDCLRTRNGLYVD